MHAVHFSVACIVLEILVQVRAGVEVAFSTVYKDTIAGETVLVEGQVPAWIDGTSLLLVLEMSPCNRSRLYRVLFTVRYGF